MLLNLSIFIWYGAVCPWASFRVNNVIPIYRLIFLGILILLFRRLPVVFAMHRKIPEIEHTQQALFVGFFGPIGVSAIFYLYVSLAFLGQITEDGTSKGVVREDAARLQDVMRVVIWFLAICSIVVHGLSVPLGKLGYNLPRQVSSAFSTSTERDSPEPVRLRHSGHLSGSIGLKHIRRRRHPNDAPSGTSFRIRGAQPRTSGSSDKDSPVEPQRPIYFPPENNTNSEFRPVNGLTVDEIQASENSQTLSSGEAMVRRKLGGEASSYKQTASEVARGSSKTPLSMDSNV